MTEPIQRLHGTTGVSWYLPDDVKEIVFTWAWLLPFTGYFTIGELAQRIRQTYSEENPKTAHDLAVLRETP
jgi:hypothetical protein